MAGHLRVDVVRSFSTTPGRPLRESRLRSSWNGSVSKTRYSANEPALALPGLAGAGA